MHKILKTNGTNIIKAGHIFLSNSNKLITTQLLAYKTDSNTICKWQPNTKFVRHNSFGYQNHPPTDDANTEHIVSQAMRNAKLRCLPPQHTPLATVVVGPQQA